MTLNKVAAEIEAQILKSCGAAIEWTFRTADQFTISGPAADVSRAVLFCVEHGLCQPEEDASYDAELDMSFAYMTAA